MIVIAGGTGVLGSAIARQLLDRGQPVRVLTRTREKAASLAARGADVAVADLRDYESLRRACEGATHVVTTANAFMGRGAESVTAVDVEGTRRLVDIARDRRVRQFVFTSALLPPAFTAVDYFAAKAQNEAHLRESGVPFTILKPTAFMETWAQMILDSVGDKGVAQIFGSGRLPINFVAVADVATVAAMTIDRADAINGVVEIGGPENLTLLEVVEIVERVTGRTAKRTHLPVPLLKVLPWVIRPFNPGMARAVHAGYYTATVSQPFDPGPMLARFPIQPTRLEDWVRQRERASTQAASEGGQQTGVGSPR